MAKDAKILHVEQRRLKSACAHAHESSLGTLVRRCFFHFAVHFYVVHLFFVHFQIHVISWTRHLLKVPTGTKPVGMTANVLTHPTISPCVQICKFEFIWVELELVFYGPVNTDKVMLLTFRLDRLNPLTGEKILVYTVLPATDNCPSWNRSVGRMAVESILWSERVSGKYFLICPRKHMLWVNLFVHENMLWVYLFVHENICCGYTYLSTKCPRKHVVGILICPRKHVEGILICPRKHMLWVYLFVHENVCFVYTYLSTKTYVVGKLICPRKHMLLVYLFVHENMLWVYLFVHENICCGYTYLSTKTYVVGTLICPRNICCGKTYLPTKTYAVGTH